MAVGARHTHLNLYTILFACMAIEFKNSKACKTVDLNKLITISLASPYINNLQSTLRSLVYIADFHDLPITGEHFNCRQMQTRVMKVPVIYFLNVFCTNQFSCSPCCLVL